MLHTLIMEKAIPKGKVLQQLRKGDWTLESPLKVSITGLLSQGHRAVSLGFMISIIPEYHGGSQKDVPRCYMLLPFCTQGCLYFNGKQI